MLKKYLGREKGITGLETAIILIAFVVVAAVFAYTALSAGLFSTQKAQEAVYSGLKEAQSTLELKGGVIATAGTVGAAGNIGQLTFVVSCVLGGASIDFTHPDSGNHTGKCSGTKNKVVINYIDKNQEVDNLYWTVTKLGSDNGDTLLDPGEKFQITVGGNSTTTGGGNLVNALAGHLLSVNQQFSIQIMTPDGAVITIERTTPAYINSIMDLK